MFQSRVGKPCTKPVKVPRPRTSVNVIQTRTPEDLPKERKTKYKIPKNIRYDLEKALVSLCDVWFEEIKPYLVRNNIKVHVHDSEINKGTDAINCSAMDARHRYENQMSTKCSHHDPASSTSSCELCRLLFNAASSIESAVGQASIATSSPTALIADTTASVITVDTAEELAKSAGTHSKMTADSIYRQMFI